jgi:hypothetical protein
MRTLTVLLLAACAGASHPTATPTTAPSGPEPSTDVTTFPSGPFHSSASFCAAWKGKRDPDVQKERARIDALCKTDPQNQECMGGCGPAADCTVKPTSVAGVKGFTSLESIDLFETCGPGNCILTVGTKQGVWAVGRVPFCSGGEGAMGSLETTSVSGDDTNGLIWKLDHQTRENSEKRDGTVTVKCKPPVGAGAPSCTVTEESKD